MQCDFTFFCLLLSVTFLLLFLLCSLVLIIPLPFIRLIMLTFLVFVTLNTKCSALSTATIKNIHIMKHYNLKDQNCH